MEKARSDAYLNSHAGASQPVGEGIPEGRRWREDSSSPCPSGKVRLVECQAEGRLTQKFDGGAIAGIALIPDDAANDAAVFEATDQVATEPAVVHRLFRGPLAGLRNEWLEKAPERGRHDRSEEGAGSTEHGGLDGAGGAPAEPGVLR
jgi:hypothetical protein